MKRILTVLLLLISFNSFGVNYYISVTGNNANNGTSAITAWRNLSYACTHTTSGDVINVLAGSFTETVQCALPVGVSVFGLGVTSIIKSTVTTQYEPIILLSSTVGTNGNQYIRDIKLDGQSLSTSWAIAVYGRSNVSIYNCTIVDFNETGVNWAGRADNNPGAPSTYATGNTFHDNIVTNCAFADPSFGRGCFQFGGQDGMLIYNNTIINKTRAEAAGGWPIKYCNDGYIKGCKIYDNYLERGPYPYNQNGTNGYWNFAIEMFNESGFEIYGNTILGSIDVNHQTLGAYSYSVNIHDNVIGQLTLGEGEESGVIMEYETITAIVYNNTIKHCAYGIYFTPRTTNHVTDITLSYNLIYDVGRNTSGGGAPAGFGIAEQTPEDGTVVSINFYVLHNTVIGASGGNAVNYGVRIPDGGPTTNARINDNILQGFATYCIVANPANVITGLQINNSDFYLNGNSNNIGFNGTPNNYTHVGNISADPLFVAGVTYVLGALSPCLGTGSSNSNMGYWQSLVPTQYIIKQKVILISH